MALTIKNPKTVSRNGYPILSITINGIKTLIDWEQRMRRHGAIFLGNDFVGKVPTITLPPDPKNGQPQPEELEGFSGDSELLKIYDDFIQQINEG